MQIRPATVLVAGIAILFATESGFAPARAADHSEAPGASADPMADIADFFPERTWKVNELGLPDSECAICRGKVFWQNRSKTYLCAKCHPPASPGLVRESVELDLDDLDGELLWDDLFAGDDDSGTSTNKRSLGAHRDGRQVAKTTIGFD